MSRDAVGAIALALALAACSGSASARQDYWQRRLARELPAGSPLSAVLTFFASNKLEHSYEPRSRMVFAIERDVENRGLMTYSVEIKCGITPQETLQSCSTSVGATGL
jgi:hypothetical protein